MLTRCPRTCEEILEAIERAAGAAERMLLLDELVERQAREAAAPYMIRAADALRFAAMANRHRRALRQAVRFYRAQLRADPSAVRARLLVFGREAIAANKASLREAARRLQAARAAVAARARPRAAAECGRDQWC